MARNDGAHRQRRDQLQHPLHVVESRLAFQFGKDHAEAVLPQRIGRDQHAVFGVEEQQRVRVVAGRGQRLPFAGADAQPVAGRHAAVCREALAVLAQRPVAQRLLVPALHRVQARRRHLHPQRPLLLQRRVAAAMVGMQVRVDQLPQRPRPQRLLQQRHGLRGVHAVAAVDQHAAIAVVEQHVVRGQPAALQQL